MNTKPLTIHSTSSDPVVPSNKQLKTDTTNTVYDTVDSDSGNRKYSELPNATEKQWEISTSNVQLNDSTQFTVPSSSYMDITFTKLQVSFVDMCY